MSCEAVNPKTGTKCDKTAGHTGPHEATDTDENGVYTIDEWEDEDE